MKQKQTESSGERHVASSAEREGKARFYGGGPVPPSEALESLTRYIEAERLLRHIALERDVRTNSVRAVLIALVTLVAGILATLPTLDKRVVPSVVAFVKAHSTELALSGLSLLAGLALAQVTLFLLKRRSENEVRRGAQEITMHLRRAYRQALVESALNPSRRES